MLLRAPPPIPDIFGNPPGGNFSRGLLFLNSLFVFPLRVCFLPVSLSFFRAAPSLSQFLCILSAPLLATGGGGGADFLSEEMASVEGDTLAKEIADATQSGGASLKFLDISVKELVEASDAPMPKKCDFTEVDIQQQNSNVASSSSILAPCFTRVRIWRNPAPESPPGGPSPNASPRWHPFSSRARSAIPWRLKHGRTAVSPASLRGSYTMHPGGSNGLRSSPHHHRGQDRM